MPVIQSKLNVRGEDFQENRRHMQELLADLRAKVELIKQGGGEKSRERHVARGKLLPRDRVQALLDPGAPFVERVRSRRQPAGHPPVAALIRSATSPGTISMTTANAPACCTWASTPRRVPIPRLRACCPPCAARAHHPRAACAGPDDAIARGPQTGPRIIIAVSAGVIIDTHRDHGQ